jgi:hypothetical protein
MVSRADASWHTPGEAAVTHGNPAGEMCQVVMVTPLRCEALWTYARLRRMIK